jgi:hypothetical protein
MYVNGLSYDEIVAKVSISKGAMANIISESKAGRIPEAGDVPEQIELLRELAVNLKKYRMTAG